MQGFTKIILIINLFIIFSCVSHEKSNAGSDGVEPDLLFSGSACSKTNMEQDALVLDTFEEFRDLLGELGKFKTHSGSSIQGESYFSKHYVLYITAGSQPSAGYYVDIESLFVEIRQDEAIVHYTLNKPPKGAVTAQMLTCPFVIVSIPANQAYSRIRIINDDADTVQVISIK